MRTIFFFLLALPFFAIAQSPAICDCADMMLAMMKETKGHIKDQVKMAAIKNKYLPKIEKCDNFLKGKSEEDRIKTEAEMKNCPSSKEADILMRELMEESSGVDVQALEIKEPNTVCDCADIVLLMINEIKGNMNDLEKIENIKNKYESKIEKCDKFVLGKSEDERIKMQEEMKKCPSALQAEILMNEIMNEKESN